MQILGVISFIKLQNDTSINWWKTMKNEMERELINFFFFRLSYVQCLEKEITV